MKPGAAEDEVEVRPARHCTLCASGMAAAAGFL
jgi:hypothetical protein